MRVIVHKKKPERRQTLTLVAGRNQMKIPDHNTMPTVKRRKSDLVLDKLEPSALPLVLGLAAFWFVVLIIATYFSR